MLAYVHPVVAWLLLLSYLAVLFQEFEFVMSALFATYQISFVRKIFYFKKKNLLLKKKPKSFRFSHTIVADVNFRLHLWIRTSDCC